MRTQNGLIVRGQSAIGQAPSSWWHPTFLLAVAVMVLAQTGCDSEEPLSRLEQSVPDTRLIGVWQSRDEDDNNARMRIVSGHGPQHIACGHAMFHSDTVLVQAGLDSAEAFEETATAYGASVFLFTTYIGDRKYLNIGNQNGFVIRAYRIEGDALIMRHMDEHLKRRAIESGQLEGMVHNAVITDTTENLFAFIAAGPDERLFSQTEHRFERVTPEYTEPQEWVEAGLDIAIQPALSAVQKPVGDTKELFPVDQWTSLPDVQRIGAEEATTPEQLQAPEIEALEEAHFSKTEHRDQPIELNQSELREGVEAHRDTVSEPEFRGVLKPVIGENDQSPVDQWTSLPNPQRVRDVETTVPEQSRASDIEAIQGVWQVVDAVLDGKSTPASLGARIGFEGNSITCRSPNGQTVTRYVGVLHPGPIFVGLDWAEKGTDGWNDNAIVLVKDDLLMLCFSPRGTQRPRALSAPEGTGRQLFTLVRVAPTKEGNYLAEGE